MSLFVSEEKKPLSVGKFLTLAKQAVESHLPPLWVSGEVGNFTCAASGHWYFALRDSDGQVDCVMLARHNVLVTAPPSMGDAVEVMAQPSLYAPRGRFQLLVRFLRQAGAGELYQIFIRRKQEWAARGWFDAEHKRPLPSWPATVGVVGSVAGAAVRDVLRTLKTRMPSLSVIVYPAPAQGADAAAKIAAAIDTASRRNECEVLIICRGGGGIEDLWAFNEEPVAKAIFNCALPVVSGIGHEIDETLADYVADVRAPTPTGAAMLASPDGVALRKQLAAAATGLRRLIQRGIDDRAQHLDWAASTISRPTQFITPKHDQWRQAAGSLTAAARRGEENCRWRWQTATATVRRPTFTLPAAKVADLSHRLLLAAQHRALSMRQQMERGERTLATLNPQRTLARGYSITRNARGHIVQDSGTLAAADDLEITLAKGTAQVTVKTPYRAEK